MWSLNNSLKLIITPGYFTLSQTVILEEFSVMLMSYCFSFKDELIIRA